jgi:hypothetical protein
MKIERYISIMVVLVVGLFIANVSWAADAPVKNETPGPACVQCFAPANTWCVPATSGAAVPEPTQPKRASAPAVKHTETPWEVLGSILAVPFEIGQCVFVGCPR